MFFEKDRFSSYHESPTKEQLVIKWGWRIGTVGMFFIVAFLLALQECKHDPVEANEAMKKLWIPELLDSARIKGIVHNPTLASFDTVDINTKAPQGGASRNWKQRRFYSFSSRNTRVIPASIIFSQQFSQHHQWPQRYKSAPLASCPFLLAS